MGNRKFKNSKDSGILPGSLLLLDRYKPIIDLLNKYQKIKDDTNKYSQYYR